VPDYQQELTLAGLIARLPALKFHSFGRRDGVANTKSAEKAAKQAEKHRARNVAARSRMRTAIRRVNDAVAAGKPEDISAALKASTPEIDSMVNKGLIHRNKAARHKSRLAAKVKKAAQA
jgi:small subunit ribosomal protein S20